MAAEGWDASVAKSVVETNIMGVLRVTAAFLPLLKKRQSATIMATSSNLAFIPQLRKIPVELLELSPPYVQTELTGGHQVTDPRAMPVAAYVAEVMQLLETGNHPRGEVLVERDRARRLAEREGRYEEVFAAINPA